MNQRYVIFITSLKILFILFCLSEINLKMLSHSVYKENIFNLATHLSHTVLKH